MTENKESRIRKIARNLRSNTKEFRQKASPIAKQEIREAGKKAYQAGKGVERLNEKALSRALKSIASQTRKKIRIKRILASGRPTVVIDNKPIAKNFDLGSFYFNDEWERTKKKIDPLADDGFFWG